MVGRVWNDRASKNVLSIGLLGSDQSVLSQNAHEVAVQ